MNTNSIELVELTKKYGSFTAVDQLNLSVPQGEVFGLLGPNGAGKSTTILMMLGLTDPNSGSVSVCGYNSTNNPIAVKRIVGYLPEDVGFYDNLTGRENLIYTARLNNVNDREAYDRADKLLKRIGLTEAAHKKAGKYSRGMRQRLGLADVLIKNPRVIILDEPTLGIDPKGVREFLTLIVELSKEEGMTVLFSSHHLHQVQQVCDRVGLLVGGKLLACGNVSTLSQKLFSNSAYLIEVGIDGDKLDAKGLNEMVKGIDGVESVSLQKERLEIACGKDISSSIARIIVEKGYGLNYLNRREYGLDDIYYRYFEGGENHG